MKNKARIPKDHPVQPLRPGDKAMDRATCGTCGLSWDDAIITSMTPAPSGRCPFGQFHDAKLPDYARERLQKKVREVFGKHTAGPWQLETVKTSIGICHKIGPFPPLRGTGEPSHACIYVDGRYKPEDDPESLANARLIAAAPDLLEACKLALTYERETLQEMIEQGEQPEGANCSASQQFIWTLENAIAKAEGK